MSMRTPEYRLRKPTMQAVGTIDGRDVYLGRNGSIKNKAEVNRRIGRIVRAFKWAVENKLAPPSVRHGLKAVSWLRRGRSEARESLPIRPVVEAFVEAVQPHVSRPVWAMIELQHLTGVRPGEACRMRTCDLDTSGRVWVYTPGSHKTEDWYALGAETRCLRMAW
jgi:integrase